MLRLSTLEVQVVAAVVAALATQPHRQRIRLELFISLPWEPWLAALRRRMPRLSKDLPAQLARSL